MSKTNKKLTVREEIQLYGVERVGDHKILSDLTGIPAVKALELIAEYGGLGYLMNNIDGLSKEITPRQLEKLTAMKELFVRVSEPIVNDDIALTSPERVRACVSDIIHEDQENFVLLILDSKNRVRKRVNLFKGTNNASIAHPRDVFREVLKFNANAIFICHNHPSGDTTPSREDLNVTLRLKEAADLFGIRLLDHVIVGVEGYYSFMENGQL